MPGVINLADPPYNVTCNYSADISSAVNAAISAVNSSGYARATLLLPGGLCLVTAGININAGTFTLKGAGKDVTTLVHSGTTGNTITVQGSAFDIILQDFSIAQQMGDTPTAGYGVEETQATNVSLRNMRIQGVYVGAAAVNTGVSGVMTIESVDFGNTVLDAVYANGVSQLFMSEVTSYQSAQQTNGGACIHLNAAAAYIQNTTCGQSTYGLLINPTFGNSVVDVFATNLELDLSQQDGVKIDGTNGSVYNIKLTNVRSGFSSGNGFNFIGTGVSHVSLIGCSAESSTLVGINVQYLADSVISGCLVEGNSYTVRGGFNGINLINGSGLVVANNRSGPYPGKTNNQGYGLAIQNTFTGGPLTVSHNILTENVIGPIFYGNPANKAILVEENSTELGLTARVMWPALGTSPWSYTAGPTPTTLILVNYVCSALQINGTGNNIFPLSNSGSLAIPLLAYQSLTGTCTTMPSNVTAIIQ
ncbi:MAG: right-handed parallel beta-helix repeat-containing protein [Candidatus Sphingomonas phytovorans]|nr:right-handed parallel beta-helix repeat-containing protein [Sphingomonas sp.]WEK00478.1 MAG: right-handed parallel beta-helix repeat-containing protein [Sphingomonas sp.]